MSGSRRGGAGGRVGESAAALSARLQRQLLRPGRRRAAPARTADLLREEEAAPRLDEGEWARVQQRSRWRKHSEGPCPICQEPFRLEEQVLLSCAHVFHAACLRSFERFAPSKRDRTCPLCRRARYEKRRIRDGADFYVHCAARTIQARWRGVVARRAFERVVRERAPRDSRLRHRHALVLFTRTTDGLAREVEHKAGALDAFFAELDAAMAASRAAMTALDAAGGGDAMSLEEWEAVHARAAARDTTECPICMSALHGKEAQLLSCSHVIHTACLTSYEAFVDGDARCPLCRSRYLRVEFRVALRGATENE